MRFNPDYSMMFWNLDNLPYDRMTPEGAKLARSNLCYVAKADLLRYEILYIFGGFYADTDMECRKNFDPLLKTSSFAGEGFPHDGIPNAIMACEPGNKIIGDVVRIVNKSIINEWNIWNDPKRLYKDAEGSMIKLSESHFRKLETIYPREYFYPFDCIDSHEIRNKTDLSKSYCIHWWNGMEKEGWSKQNNAKIIKDGLK
jgi:mannosyltransferase OCH1-like enzyme